MQMKFLILQKKWNNKVKKLKRRENKLKDGMEEIEKRQLINDVNTIADAELTKQLLDSIPVARAYDFLNKLKDLANRKNLLTKLKTDVIKKLTRKLIRYTNDNIRKKLRQWLDKAKKINESSDNESKKEDNNINKTPPKKNYYDPENDKNK